MVSSDVTKRIIMCFVCATGAHTCKLHEVCVRVCGLYLVFMGTWTLIAR